MGDSTEVEIESLRAKLSVGGASVLPEIRSAAEALALRHPSDAWLRAEIGGVFDSNGFEEDACPWYEKALAFGFDSFPPDQAPHFCVWYGSTLRNVKRYHDSERVLRSALERWPRVSVLQFFLALTLMSQGKAMDAIVALAELQTPGWDDSTKSYQGAIQSYLDEELRPATRRPNLGAARLVVRDVSESAPWYEKVLGVPPGIVEEKFVLFRMGCSTLELVNADEKNPFADGGSISYWNVAPIEEWIERFKENGATVFRGPGSFEKEGLMLCMFRDPFGCLIGLQQYRVNG